MSDAYALPCTGTLSYTRTLSGLSDTYHLSYTGTLSSVSSTYALSYTSPLPDMSGTYSMPYIGSMPKIRALSRMSTLSCIGSGVYCHTNSNSCRVSSTTTLPSL